MRHYIALIRKEPEGDFGVSFPDFPGCVTAGRSLDEARAFAHEALQLHVDGMAEDGIALPEPSSLETVMADPDDRDAVALLVSVSTGAAKAVRVSITVPEDALAEMDRYARSHGMTRSGFLVRAARAIMNKPDQAA
jgi:predicted RNase H-like HicB family nuclease